MVRVGTTIEVGNAAWEHCMAPWTGEWDLHSISEKQGVLGLLAGKLG
jgi:hypothetical protein